METFTVILLVFSVVFFLARYARRRMSLDFISMIFGLLALLSVLMDATLSDNERLVMFFVPFIIMMLSGVALLDQDKKW